ncbi:hypothetical protein X801_08611, partial [Opisthorchis viverrini]
MHRRADVTTRLPFLATAPECKADSSYPSGAYNPPVSISPVQKGDQPVKRTVLPGTKRDDWGLQANYTKFGRHINTNGVISQEKPLLKSS